MFAAVPATPPDPILGLAAVVRADPRPGRIDLTAGVYRDETGRTPPFASVSEATARVVAAMTDWGYLPIAGAPAYRDAVTRLVLAGDYDAVSERAWCVQTPGGTGGLAVATAFARRAGAATIWLPAPTWPNHKGIAEQAGLQVRTYRYGDETSVWADALVEDLGAVGGDEVVLLHACCHNPTGNDPDAALWETIAALLAERGVPVLLDAAYLGLGRGFDGDRVAVRAMVAAGVDLMVCVSFSKNMSLYRERVGALVAVAPTPEAAANTLGNVEAVVRPMYSNPPAFGATVAATVLGDDALRAQWIGEVATLQGRLSRLRTRLAKGLAERGVALMPSVEAQAGMFAMTGLDPDAVERLRSEFAIYVLGNGRANLAGLADDATVERFCDALQVVTA
ncbi:MAG: aromatic amino acid transaminase [Acidimicrobiia bacterium]